MKNIKEYRLFILIAALMIVSAFFIYRKLNPPKLPPNLVLGTGHIDGYVTKLNTKYPGRVIKLALEDGLAVKNGQILAQLDSKELRDKVKELKYQIEAKNEILLAKNIELNIAKKELSLLLNVAMNKLESAKAQKKSLEEEINSLSQVVSQDIKDYKRSKNLYQNKLIAPEKYEKIELKYKTDLSSLNALKYKLIISEALIKEALSNYKKAQVQQNKVEALKYEIAALKKEIKSMQYALSSAQTVVEEMSIKSPINGYVLEKIANKGEVLGAGQVLATLIDPKTLYLKIYIDTLENGKIAIGDKAEIFLDSYPNKPIEAKVVRVAQKAEFTPKTVSVRSDRIQRVFAVDLKPLSPNPLLKIGLPAIGVISINGKGLPQSLNELPPI